MIEFTLSFLLVFLSSYFLTSIIAPKKSILGVIYLFLLSFAQIVLCFEILSLFSAIKPNFVLLVNGLFLCCSLYGWNKMSRPLWSLDCGDFRNRIINSLKLDKTLMFLYVAFCVFILASLFLGTTMPITNSDALSYHVNRSLYWVLQGNLNHFDIPDIRNLCLPINSEILYAWVILFVKKDIFLGLFSFIGYFLAITSLYNILGYLGYCVRKRLWVIFILSSFSSVIVQVSGTETDIIIAGLVLSSVYLFWNGLKTKKIMPVFMASLAYALAVGTKTPSLIMIPAVGVFLISLCAYYKNFKYFGYFLGLGFANFLIFSSYNYILNFIQFSNFFGPGTFLVVSKNYFGFKGAIANFIKYIYLFIDFTGFRCASLISPYVEHLRSSTLAAIHLKYIPDGLYTEPYKVNMTLLEPIMGAGILGFTVFLPCLVVAFFRPLSLMFKRKVSKKVCFLFLFAVIFIINLCVISYTIAYMVYSVRFIMSFMVLSSPILIYSYFSKRNPLKYIIVLFAFIYMFFVSTSLWPRPFFKVVQILIKQPSISKMRDVISCKNYNNIKEESNSMCIVTKQIERNFTKDTKFLAFVNTSTPLYILKSLGLDGYHIDTALLEDSSKINFDNYDIIIAPAGVQISSFIKDYNTRKNYYSVNGQNLKILKSDPVPCYYSKNITIPNYDKEPPYQVRCAMSSRFVSEKHLKFMGFAGFQDHKPLGEETNSFIFYKSTKFGPKNIKQRSLNKIESFKYRYTGE